MSDYLPLCKMLRPPSFFLSIQYRVEYVYPFEKIEIVASGKDSHLETQTFSSKLQIY